MSREEYQSKYHYLSLDLNPWRSRTPFFLRFRDCKEAFPSPDKFHIGGITTRDAPPGWAQRIIDAGRGLLLLDGLDELAPMRRSYAIEWIKELTALHPANIILVTSRPQAVAEEALKDHGFLEYGVRALSPDGKVEFIRNWHCAVKQRLAATPDQATALDAKRQRILDQLKINRSVDLLASNPLLCARLCALNRVYQQSLPENLRDLCASSCQMLLWDRDQMQDIAQHSFIPAYDKQNYLTRRLLVRDLAYTFVKQGVPVLSRSAVIDHIATSLHGAVHPDHAEAAEVLRGLLDRSGLLRAAGEDDVEFVHNSLRDYLASWKLVKLKEDSYLVKQIDAGDIERWEPILLLAAATDEDPEFGPRLLTRLLTIRSQQPARRRLRELMALKVAAHIPTPIGAELTARINAIRDQFLPLNTIGRVEALAEAGEIALGYLCWQENQPEDIAAACVRGLGTLKSEQAANSLRTYLQSDHRPLVLDALAQFVPLKEMADCVELLTIPSVVEHLQTRIPNDESATELWRRRNSDLTPLSGLTQLLWLYLQGSAVSDGELERFNHERRFQQLRLVNIRR